MAQECLMAKELRLNLSHFWDCLYSRCPTLPGRRGQGKLSIEKRFSIGVVRGTLTVPLIGKRDACQSDLETIGVKLRKQRDVADGRHGDGEVLKQQKTQPQVALMRGKIK